MSGKRSHQQAFDASKPASAAAPPAKKMASIFGPRAASPLKWVAKDEHLWHVRYGEPRATEAVAMFDLDGVIVKDSRNPAWWHASVPAKLRELVDGGTAVYILSNQGNVYDGLAAKLEGVLQRLALPVHLLAATRDSWHRKPMPGMFAAVERLNAGVAVDRARSVFVGDAAGRAGDHSDSDRKWALNVGVAFQTPEQYFLGRAEQPYKLHGLDARRLLDAPPPALFTPSNTPLLRDPTKGAELVVLVGAPAAGKSHFARHHLAPAGYAVLDAGREGVFGRIAERLAAGASVVVDGRLPSSKARAPYLEAAARAGAPARCFRLAADAPLAWHLNLARAYAPSWPDRAKLVPAGDYGEYAASYEAPSTAEGFAEVKAIHFVYRGADDDAGEAARREFGMWLGLNRKASDELEGKPAKPRRY